MLSRRRDSVLILLWGGVGSEKKLDMRVGLVVNLSLWKTASFIEDRVA
jgi:hypothetical protein